MLTPPPSSFLWNDRIVTPDDVAPGRLLLDYLRRDLRSVGTKEGCREGDCGACAVLLGELGKDGTVTYRAVPSCMVLVGHVAGRHVVTIEGLNPGRGLSPVQAAVVEHGGSQCGFCTPGFIISFTGFLLNATEFTTEEAKSSIAGNLCRCTGYVSLVRAGAAIASHFEGLTAPGAGRIETLVATGALPTCFDGAANKLASIQTPDLPYGSAESSSDLRTPFAGPLGGGTDLIVQQGAKLDELAPRILFRSEEERAPYLEGDQLVLPGDTTFEDLHRCQTFTQLWPMAAVDLERFASGLIRERATVAGNIANASPIADGTAMLLALGAELELTTNQGAATRRLPLGKLFLGYKQLALEPKETIHAIRIPGELAPGRHFSFEKVSKREYLDIATVTTGFSATLHEGTFECVLLSAGGVGPTPMLLEQTASFLEGKPVCAASVLEAAAVIDTEIAPISDVRGSADYKRLLLRQLFFAHVLKLFPDLITESGLMEVSA
ncbi:MAG: xanthine dehydrogenase small subunit [Planctomycetota bacterium]|jgi:xanthine dehydrogenase small subunit